MRFIVLPLWRISLTVVAFRSAWSVPSIYAISLSIESRVAGTAGTRRYLLEHAEKKISCTTRNIFFILKFICWRSAGIPKPGVVRFWNTQLSTENNIFAAANKDTKLSLRMLAQNNLPAQYYLSMEH
jgi:hypothetical protein